MYKPPIKLEEGLVTEVIKEHGDEIVAKVKTVLNVQVDEKELLKALEYDRNQYENGYRDGYKCGYESARDKFIDILNDSLTEAINDAIKTYDDES